MKAGIRCKRIIKTSRGAGEVNGFDVREGAPWLIAVNICKE